MQGLFCIKSVHAFVYIMGGVGPGVVYMNTSTKSVLTGALFNLHHFYFWQYCKDTICNLYECKIREEQLTYLLGFVFSVKEKKNWNKLCSQVMHLMFLQECLCFFYFTQSMKMYS